jgi:hypothetical protein
MVSHIDVGGDAEVREVDRCPSNARLQTAD